MKILVTGSHGLIGSALVSVLSGAGHEILRASHRHGDLGSAGKLRSPADGRVEILYDLKNGFAPESVEAMAGLDAVVHLAGESIDGAWTARKKQEIRDSRVRPLQLLRELLGKLSSPPSVLLTASAVGVYGDRGDDELDESAGPAGTFLAGVVREVESEAAECSRLGMRTAFARFAVVLDARSGALAKMLRPFRMGLGGPLGGGRQWWSWIAMDDAVAALQHVLLNPTLSGAINIASPNPVRNAQFARTLGKVLGRPALLGVPSMLLRILAGQLADEVLLASARVVPRRLVESGFEFRYPELEPALRHLLAK